MTMVQRSPNALILPIILFIHTITLAQWQQVKGPEGFDESATVNSLVAMDSVLFAGCYYGSGVLRSTNYGTTWTTINTGLSNKWVFSLSTVGKYIFAGTDGGGVYRSTDDGQDWVQMNSGLTGWQAGVYVVSSFCVVKDTNVFVGTARGVFLSVNYDTTWTEKNDGLVLLPTSSLTAIGANLFAATNSGVFRSTNNGTTWVTTNNGITSDIITCLMADNSNLYAGTIGGIFLSTDLGANWSSINKGLALPSNSVLSLVRVDTNIFAGTWDGVYFSTNNGETWNAFNTGLNSTSINTIARCGTNLFAGTTRNGLWYRPLSETATSAKNLEASELPTQYSLKQNYPNPFNPTTTIAFELSTKSFISLKVFELSGRLVSVLESRELPAGRYARQWNAKDFPTGVYFYSLEADGYRESKKCVLLK